MRHDRYCISISNFITPAIFILNRFTCRFTAIKSTHRILHCSGNEEARTEHSPLSLVRM